MVLLLLFLIDKDQNPQHDLQGSTIERLLRPPSGTLPDCLLGYKQSGSCSLLKPPQIFPLPGVFSIAGTGNPYPFLLHLHPPVSYDSFPA